jgi:hypothetical protein
VPDPVAGPLRILLVGVWPRGSASSASLREFEELEAALRLPGVEVVSLAGADLVSMLRTREGKPCHILHLFGETVSGRTGAQGVSAAFADREGPPFSDEDLARLLVRRGQPCAVSLSAAPGRDEEGTPPPFGLATALMARGVQGVVIAPRRVRGGTLIPFWRALVGGVAAGTPFEAASGAARRTAWMESISSPAWAAPVVWSATPAGEVFRLTRGPGGAAREALPPAVGGSGLLRLAGLRWPAAPER